MRNASLPALLAAVALVAGVAIPLLALIPLGWVWVWQNGLLLHWLAGALAVSIVAFLVRLWLLRRVSRMLGAAGSGESPPGLDSSPSEKAAWQAVEVLAAEVDPARIGSRDDLLALGIATVERVAEALHPGEQDAVWKFTLPEALALVETVSHRLRLLMLDSIPLSDQLTVRQLWRLYRWRSMIDVADKAYDVWRIIRLTNPWVAATQEVRERLSKVVYQDLRTELARRLAATYVREVGRAAIDLYSGRARLTSDELSAHVSRATARDRATPESAEPLRLLVAGQVGAGKSSLVNALASEIRAAADVLPTTRGVAGYEVRREGLPPVMLVDSPGLTTDPATAEAVVEAAADCDLVLWVAAANRADRAVDAAGLAAMRAAIAARAGRRLPPVVLVLTHIDRLRPAQEWNPPYDIGAPATAKATAIRGAMEAAAGDLALPATDVVPVCLGQQLAPYNVDVVWAKIAALLPEAKGAQLLRCLADADRGLDWRRVLVQAQGAGRLLIDVVVAGTIGRSKDPGG